MKQIVKIQEIGLAKLNNAEYTNFSTRVLTLVEQAGTLEPDGGSALRHRGGGAGRIRNAVGNDERHCGAEPHQRPHGGTCRRRQAAR